MTAVVVTTWGTGPYSAEARTLEKERGKGLFPAGRDAPGTSHTARPLHRPTSHAEGKQAQRGHPTLARGRAGLTREGGIHGAKHLGPPNMPRGVNSLCGLEIEGRPPGRVIFNPSLASGG